MYKIEYETPLHRGSEISFVINDNTYLGEVEENRSNFYVLFSEQHELYHTDIVDIVFTPLGTSPEAYYKKVTKEDDYEGAWPETLLEVLEEVLSQMQKDYEKLNKTPTINLSRFRFKIGDTILYENEPYKIAGYYFHGMFNSFDEEFGYVIEGYPGGHKGTRLGYDEYGNILSSHCDDKWYIKEKEAYLLKEQSILNNQKNGNEIKLQRAKAIIKRGTIPAGYRICSKVHKTAISSQSLSYTEIVRGG